MSMQFPQLPKSCHLCLELSVQYCKCSKPRCKTVYCRSCLKSQFKSNFDEANYNPDYWICYACGGSCKCLRCTGIVSTKLTRSIPVPRKNRLKSKDSKQTQNRNGLPISEDIDTNKILHSQTPVLTSEIKLQNQKKQQQNAIYPRQQSKQNIIAHQQMSIPQNQQKLALSLFNNRHLLKRYCMEAIFGDEKIKQNYISIMRVIEIKSKEWRLLNK